LALKPPDPAPFDFTKKSDEQDGSDKVDVELADTEEDEQTGDKPVVVTITIPIP
jgi:hypothetical protein